MLGKWWGSSDTNSARVPVRPFHVPPRTAVFLGWEDWRYGSIPLGPVTVCVERVRWEKAGSYDVEVWIDGYVVDVAGVEMEYAELLVLVAALRRAVPDTDADADGQGIDRGDL